MVCYLSTALTISKCIYNILTFSSLALWNVAKKKPQVVVQKAHKSEENGDAKTNENWITSLAALQNTDLIASGDLF